MGEHGRVTLGVVLFAGLALASLVWPILDYILTAILAGAFLIGLLGLAAYWFIGEWLFSKEMDRECAKVWPKRHAETPKATVPVDEEVAK